MRKGTRIPAQDARVIRKPSRTAVLAGCMHTNSFRSPLPALGDMVWCPTCRDYRAVLLLQNSWTVRCKVCSYSRSFERAHFAASKSARKHHDRSGHDIELYDGTELVHTYEQGPDQLPINTEGDPPF